MIVNLAVPHILTSLSSAADFRTSAVNAASGSAYAEIGNTQVIVSV